MNCFHSKMGLCFDRGDTIELKLQVAFLASLLQTHRLPSSLDEGGRPQGASVTCDASRWIFVYKICLEPYKTAKKG